MAVAVRRRVAAIVMVLTVSLVTVMAGALSSQPGGAGRLGRQNTWSARSSTGLTLGGTWTGSVDPNTGAASGSWTLLGANGQPAMRGGWSAIKSPGGWTGAWRANVVGSRGEYSGTWNSTVDLKAGAAFADLFALALQNVITGTWRAGAASGSWSIRAFAPSSDDVRP